MNNSKKEVKFSSTLKDIISKSGLTKSAFADKVGISRVMLTTYESGKSQPSLDALVKLSTYTGLSIDQLVFGVDTMTSREMKQEAKLEALRVQARYNKEIMKAPKENAVSGEFISKLRKALQESDTYTGFRLTDDQKATIFRIVTAYLDIKLYGEV